MKYLLALVILCGCSAPAARDPKKAAAYRDEVATMCSLTILWAPAAYRERTVKASQAIDADGKVMFDSR